MARSRSTRPTGRLAALSAARAKNTVMLGDIQAHLLDIHSKPDPGRRQDVIHPSEMAKSDWCPRQTAYRISGATPSDPRPVVGFQLQTIFEAGHDIHTRWQGWVRDIGKLWGKWKCEVCEHTWYATSPDECEWCHRTGLITYKEVDLDGYDKYLITGHADGAYKRGIIEVKSIGMGTLRMEAPELLRKYRKELVDGGSLYDLDGLWKDLNTPLASHARQTNIYARIAREMGLPIEVEEVLYFYEFKANQAVKEIRTKPSARIADPLFEKALEVKEAVEKGLTLPRPDGVEKGKKPCSECMFKTKCYSSGPKESRGSATAPVQRERYLARRFTAPGYAAAA